MCINEVKLKSNTYNVNRKIMQGAVHFFINVTVYGQALVCDPPAVWILPNDLCAVQFGVFQTMCSRRYRHRRERN